MFFYSADNDILKTNTTEHRGFVSKLNQFS